MLSDFDRAEVIGDRAFSSSNHEIESVIEWAWKCYVTRNMTKAERVSPKGRAALADELMKVIQKGTFGVPVNDAETARRQPKATVSGLCMLASVKYAEKIAELQKMKGRIVVLGNKIFFLGSGKQTFPTGHDFGLYGDVASLAAFRAVAFHSTKKDMVLESADVANAYLNAEWPEGHEPHYLRVDRQVYELLNDEWKAMVDRAGGPGRALLPMRKCLYGHPLSGFLWIQQLHQWLLDEDFKLVDGVKALYKKGDVLVCAYVDDLAVAGPRDQVDALWKKLSKEYQGEKNEDGKYDLREVGECTEFLGVQVKRYESPDGHGFNVDLSMEDYCKSIVKTFEELFHEETQWISPKEAEQPEGCLISDQYETSLGPGASNCATCSDCHWAKYLNRVHNDRNVLHERLHVALDERDPGETCEACQSIRKSVAYRTYSTNVEDTSAGGVGAFSSPGGDAKNTSDYSFPAFAAKRKVKQSTRLSQPAAKKLVAY